MSPCAGSVVSALGCTGRPGNLGRCKTAAPKAGGSGASGTAPAPFGPRALTAGTTRGLVGGMTTPAPLHGPGVMPLPAKPDLRPVWKACPGPPSIGPLPPGGTNVPRGPFPGQAAAPGGTT
eukprot:CAMPEP_0170575610 /NCGR_PEP_ID=MMETSP0224-20130122/3955_1 /TAXON_ID=285029 /ORGANISM="Togula jolla, Strain CCCM 725" /LENGTH=120 /DNA_ID=CAMNT_0010898405 /DNA_START=37 /DNA_END=395 /DNA_ORIENTATION=+